MPGTGSRLSRRLDPRLQHGSRRAVLKDESDRLDQELTAALAHVSGNKAQGLWLRLELRQQRFGAVPAARGIRVEE